MIEGKKISALLPKSWKKSFHSEIILTTKMGFCNYSNDKRLCNRRKFKLPKKGIGS